MYVSRYSWGLARCMQANKQTARRKLLRYTATAKHQKHWTPGNFSNGIERWATDPNQISWAGFAPQTEHKQQTAERFVATLYMLPRGSGCKTLATRLEHAVKRILRPPRPEQGPKGRAGRRVLLRSTHTFTSLLAGLRTKISGSAFCVLSADLSCKAF